MRLLQWTSDFFRKRGSDSPRLDAEILLAHARGCSRIELYTAFDTEPTEEQREAFREMVRRRGEGMPVAYLVGYREFYSLKLRVNESVLIPRPETEHLVIEALDQAKRMRTAAPDQTLHLADVGTGSGAIAIAIAKHLPNSLIQAVDISPDALQIARWNVEQLGVTEQVELIEGDLLEPLTEEPTLDLIVSNPPYVSEAEYAALDKEVKDFEPKLALVSGPQGTELIEKLAGQAASRLRPGGRLIVELSPMIADACQEIFAQTGCYEDIKFVKDLAGHRRILSCQRSR